MKSQVERGFHTFVRRWLGITSVGVVERMGCSNLPLSSKQKDVCKKKPYLLPSIKDGARLGIAECQSQFRHERWNCSTTKQPSVFGYELTSGEDIHTHTKKKNTIYFFNLSSPNKNMSRWKTGFTITTLAEINVPNCVFPLCTFNMDLLPGEVHEV